jgi:RHS repeat-associated protein
MSEIALDLATGTSSVSGDGLFNYVYQLQVPSGIGDGNQPKLALQYRQHGPNGYLGLGWSLSGVPAIIRDEPTLADRVVSQQRITCSYRFFHNNQQLYNVTGQYAADNTIYRTELDTRCTFHARPNGAGFVVIYDSGRVVEYGVTPETRVLATDGQTMQWLIGKDTDLLGNYVAYSYRTTPTGSASFGALPDRIVWTSNDRAQAKCQGLYIVRFEYQARDDSLEYTSLGGIDSLPVRLQAIRVLAQKDGTSHAVRDYKLEYSYSSYSKSSTLTSISMGGMTPGTYLSPTTFKYSDLPTDSARAPLYSEKLEISTMASEWLPSLLTINTSGRGFTDLVVLHQGSGTDMVASTYLAELTEVALADGTKISVVKWTLSLSDKSTAKLHLRNIEFTDNVFDPLSGSLLGDTRADIIIPSVAPGNKLLFSVLKSVGDGYNDAIIVDTGRSVAPRAAAFFLVDFDGDGRQDIVQAYHDKGGPLKFRVFYGIEGCLKEPQVAPTVVESVTTDTYGNTVCWSTIRLKQTSATALLRVYWARDPGSRDLNRPILRATTYAPEGSARQGGSIKQNKATDLGRYPSRSPMNAKRFNAFSLDVNNDGIQDLVTCERNYIYQANGKVRVSFTFKTYVSDGLGGFILPPREGVHSVDVPRMLNGDWNVSSKGGTSASLIQYTFREGPPSKQSSNLWAITFAPRANGIIEVDTGPAIIASPSKLRTTDYKGIQRVDIRGSGLSDWIVVTGERAAAGKTLFNVSPIFNMDGRGDMLKSIADPIGLKTTVKYLPMTVPSAYSSRASWNSRDIFSLVGKSISSRMFVVNEVVSENALGGPDIAWRDRRIWSYHDARADLVGGRGWLGFGSITITETEAANASTIDEYYRDWPLTGLLKSSRRLNGSQGQGTQGSSLQVVNADYMVQPVAVDNKYVSINRVLPLSRRTAGFKPDGTTVDHYSEEWTYDMYGNVIGEEKRGSDQKSTFTLTSYKTIGGRHGYAVAKKITQARDTSRQINTWYLGDLSLEKFDYDSNGLLTTMDRWSSSASTFCRKQFVYDNWGNVTQWSDEAKGLRVDIEFDKEYHIFPMRKTSKPLVEDPNLPFDLTATERIAYDFRIGEIQASEDRSGIVICVEYDDFGRKLRTWKTAPEGTGSGSIIASNNLRPAGLQITDGFHLDLRGTRVTPFGIFSYLRTSTNALVRVSQAIFGSNASQSETAYELVDCNGLVRKKFTAQGTNKDLSCQISTYDSRRQKSVESSFIAFTYRNDWTEALGLSVDEKTCTRHYYDGLGRIYAIKFPQTAGLDGAVIESASAIEYSEGGLTKTVTTTASSHATSIVLEVIKSAHMYVASELRIVSKIHGPDGHRSTFDYDGLGRLTSTTAYGSDSVQCSKETTTYDSFDNITSRQSESVSSLLQPQITRFYDAANRLQSETKFSKDGSIKEVTRFTYDKIGRLESRLMPDGRVARFRYRQNGVHLDYPISAWISKTSDESEMESSICYTYNNRGLVSKREVQVDFGKNTSGNSSRSYEETYGYDWQDQLVDKILPLGARVSRKYDGTRTRVVKLIASQECTVDYLAYHPNGRAKLWKVTTATRTTAGTKQAMYSYSTDVNDCGDLTTYSMKNLSNGSEKLVESYTYETDILGRLKSMSRPLYAMTGSFEYQGSRISKSANVYHHEQNQLVSDASYEYDDAGNMTKKTILGTASEIYNGPHEIRMSSGGHDELIALFDAMGRLQSRIFNPQFASFHSRFSFHVQGYDGFGKMASLQMQSDQSVTRFMTDAEGHNIAKYVDGGEQTSYVSEDCTARHLPSGKEIYTFSLFGNGSTTLTFTVGCDIPNTPTGEGAFSVYAHDRKGSVVMIFNGNGQQTLPIETQSVWGDFGSAPTIGGWVPGPGYLDPNCDVTAITFEEQSWDGTTGLLNFRGRWYDPVLARFTTADDIDVLPSLTMLDGINRHAFELNDPVNKIDPSGHISLNVSRDAWIGMGVGAGSVLLGVAVSIFAPEESLMAAM